MGERKLDFLFSSPISRYLERATTPKDSILILVVRKFGFFCLVLLHRPVFPSQNVETDASLFSDLASLWAMRCGEFNLATLFTQPVHIPLKVSRPHLEKKSEKDRMRIRPTNLENRARLEIRKKNLCVLDCAWRGIVNMPRERKTSRGPVLVRHSVTNLLLLLPAIPLSLCYVRNFPRSDFLETCVREFPRSNENRGTLIVDPNSLARDK